MMKKNIDFTLVLDGDEGDGVTVLPRDVVFLVDVSTSITKNVWDEVKWGLVDIIGTVCNGIGPDPDRNNRQVICTSFPHSV